MFLMFINFLILFFNFIKNLFGIIDIICLLKDWLINCVIYWWFFNLLILCFIFIVWCFWLDECFEYEGIKFL